MEKKTLIVLVGLPGAGKTTATDTIAHALHAGIVSPDAIRLALHGLAFVATAEPVVWMIAEMMVPSLFKAGHNFVIVDATNISPERRKRWKNKDWITEYIVFDVPIEVCKDRVIKRGQPNLVPIIDRMHAAFEWPQSLEGEVRLRLTEEDGDKFSLYELVEKVWIDGDQEGFDALCG